jgi:hypothetical protein
MSNQTKGQVQEEQPSSRVFNPNEHLIQIRSGQTSKDYLPVQWRLVWFRSAFPQGSIETEMLHLDMDRDTEEESYVWNAERRRSEKVIKQAKGFCVFHAVVKDGVGGVAMGTKSEKAASFPDFIEKAETGSIGRALAALGYGTQFAPELDEMPRIVDSPVDHAGTTVNAADRQVSELASNGADFTSVRPTGAATNGTNRSAQNASANRSAAKETPTDATEQQLSSIRKLCEHLGKAIPEEDTILSFADASKMIQQLTAEYRESKQHSKIS